MQRAPQTRCGLVAILGKRRAGTGYREPFTALKHIGYILRFLWNATRGHHLTPWRSSYLRWRIETYTGIKMQSMGFPEFCEFSWRERRELLRFLKWTGEMERYARVKPKNP